MDTRRASQDALVTGFGIATSLAVAYGLSTLEVWYGVSLYAVMFFWIVPVVAIIAGLLSASGYYFGALLFHHRPSRSVKISMVLVAIAAFFFIHLMTYMRLQIDGALVKDHISFFSYLHESYTHLSLQFRRGAGKGVETGELGLLGYGVAVLQVIGFAGGGSWIFFILADRPHCESCGRYLSKRGKQTRYAKNEQEFSTWTQELMSLMAAGRLQDAIDAHSTFGPKFLWRRRSLRSTLDVRECGICGQHWMRHKLERIKDRWAEDQASRREAFTNEELSFPPA